MNAPRHLPGRRSQWPSGIVLPLTVGIALLGSWPCPGQPPAGRVPALPRLTRAELMKKWDLNGDGSLDAGEVEVASSKMRLERAELRLNTGLDPVTGKPREGESDTDENPEDTAEPRSLTVDELAAKLGFEPHEPSTDPQPKPKAPPRFFGIPPGRIQATVPPMTDATTNRSRVIESAPRTGGVRAGGQAARPGYGSGLAAPTLNAGRSDAVAPAGGGLLPRLRQSVPPRGLQPAPVAPRPRRTVEDFDVYR